jgi:hypothetical protein
LKVISIDAWYLRKAIDARLGGQSSVEEDFDELFRQKMIDCEWREEFVGGGGVAGVDRRLNSGRRAALETFACSVFSDDPALGLVQDEAHDDVDSL